MCDCQRRQLSGAQVPAALTDREREVMALVAEGLSNDEIAGRLFLSPLTSKTHVSRIMRSSGSGAPMW
jgi:DNA-binding CsgD family transcriptional regulator